MQAFTKQKLATVLMGCMAGVALPGLAMGADVLYIHSTQGANPTNAGDQVLIDRIQNVLGFSVVAMEQGVGMATMQAEALNHTMVFLSESVSSGGVGNTFRDTPKPVVVAEPFVWDDMGLSEGGALSGYSNGIKTVNILLPAHPLAGGLSGNDVVVFSQDPAGTVWGTPAPTATVVMQTPSFDGLTLIDTHFAYATGAVMVGGFVAPAPRLAFALQNLGRTDNNASSNAYLNLNANGLAIFDAAIRYYVPEPTAAVMLVAGVGLLMRRRRRTRK